MTKQDKVTEITLKYRKEKGIDLRVFVDIRDILIWLNEQLEYWKNQSWLNLKNEKEEYDTYHWYFHKCDVDECDEISCNGGGYWRDTGYWSVCSKHAQDYRDNKPQPKMKQSAIDRENSRDKKTGYLPIMK